MKPVSTNVAEKGNPGKNITDLLKFPLVIDRKLFDILVERVPFKETRYTETADILLGMIMGNHPSRFKDVFTAKRKYGESWCRFLPTKEREAWNRDRQSIIQAFRGVSVALVYALEGLPTSNRRRSEKPLVAYAPYIKGFKTEERLAEYLKEQYWKEGKSFNTIGQELDVSGKHIEDLFIKFHIRSRRRGERPPRKKY